MPKFAVIITAAGRSSRFKDANYKKQFAILNQKAVWLHPAERFLKRDDVKQVIVVISEEDRESFMTKFGPNLAVLGIDLTFGGIERSDSVGNALKKLKDTIEYVAVHDAARPCTSDDDIEKVFQAAVKSGAAILATPINATLKRSSNKKQIDETVDRSNLWQAQTPQVFQRSLLVEAYDNIGNKKPTDESQLIEQAGHKVTLVEGSPLNIKITSKQDLRLAKACLDAMPKPKFDAPIHPFADDTLWR